MKLPIFSSLFFAAVALYKPNQVSAQGDCGSLVVGFEDYKCGSDNALNNNARKVIYDAMEQAIEEFTDIEVDLTRDILETVFAEGEDPVVGYPTDEEVNGNGGGNGGGNANGNANGNNNRNLVGEVAPQKSLDIESIVSGGDERRLFSCGPSSSNYGYYPYCSWCGYCRRRELMEEVARQSGRSLDEVQDSICAKIQEIVDDGKGVGCLKGSVVKECIFTDPTRKEGVEVSASDGGDGSSGDSGASSVLSVVVPAVTGATMGFMALA